MCYSAQIQADYREFVRQYGALLSRERFVELFWRRRRDGTWTRIPRGMREAFRHRDESSGGEEITKLVAEGDDELAARYRAELATQEARVTKAQSILAGGKPTKKAADDVRIASGKIKAAQRNLDDLLRPNLLGKDSRIFPGYYAPVMVEEGGQRVIVPMRYQCRLPGWTEATERKYPGTYNARIDKLESSWAGLFGYRHGLALVQRFYENVSRHKLEGRELRDGEAEESVVVEFAPDPPQDMLVACLWNVSEAADNGGDLYSFAAITDEPPPEIRAVGHDRCIIPIKPKHVDRWLRPDPDHLETFRAILDDRERPCYTHRLAP